MCLCAVLVSLRPRLRKRIALQIDQLKDVIFKKYKANIKRHFTADAP